MTTMLAEEQTRVISLEKEIAEMKKRYSNLQHMAQNLLRPNTIEKISRKISSHGPMESKKLYKVASDIKYIKQQFKLLEMMYLNKDEVLKQLHEDQNGDILNSIEDIINEVLQIMLDKLFDPNEYCLDFARDYMGDLTDLSLKYNDYILSEGVSAIDWCTNHVRPVKITINEDWKKVHFSRSSLSCALFFSYFFEIIFNAFKYADHNKDEFLTIDLSSETECLTISWKNPKYADRELSFGTGKGISLSASYIDVLNEEKIKSQEIIIQDDIFQVLTRIDRNIFILD